MTPFATEFPVKKVGNRASFVAEVIAWLRGNEYSAVLTSASDKILDGENVHLQTESGEELRFRELGQAHDWEAIGFRHDFPDDQGRLWRTEGVLRRAAGEQDQDLIRLRTQCLATTPSAHLESPRKPYLIKSLLKDGWGGSDATLSVSDQPVWLDDSESGLVLARAATLGEATQWLPIVYLSATGNEEWLLNRNAIEKLSYDLGGVAHVLVEPNRTFSFRLRDKCASRNVYGGTLGLSVPGQGIVRRYYLGWQIQDSRELALAVKVAAIRLRGQMPSVGWDWTDLQERSLRKQREAYRGALSVADSEALFDEYGKQLEDLKTENLQLREQLRTRVAEGGGTEGGEFSSENLVRRIGPEVYAGEISDRLRFAARATLSIGDQIGLDGRSRVVFQRILDRLPISPALNELLQDLARATKDPKRVSTELTSLLVRHGYLQKSDNKHIRLEANVGFDGLDSITLPKTPGENRGLKNLCKQIERTLGLTKLEG